MRRKQLATGWILLIIIGLVLFAALIAPAESNTGGGHSTYSSGPTGARLAFDLSRRLGWPSERREAPFLADSSSAPVQALIGVPLGADETHKLLEHVRHGGSLLVAGIDGDLGDSLHATAGNRELTTRVYSSDCPQRDPFENVLQGTRPIAAMRWRRPSSADTVGFGILKNGVEDFRAGFGFPLGSGRVVAVADPDFLSNDVMRICASEADIAYVRMLEYLTVSKRGARIAFDEFHHGRGVHGGSLSAIQTYVATTPSGRMLGQIALAGLLLLIAAAPRPLAPRDPARIARRSPLEHADALAHAYAAVGATRTATSRLLAGVRRRAHGGRPGSRETDEQLLASATAMAPAASPAASLVARALVEALPSHELTNVATALLTVESALTSRPITRKS